MTAPAIFPEMVAEINVKVIYMKSSKLYKFKSFGFIDTCTLAGFGVECFLVEAFIIDLYWETLINQELTCLCSRTKQHYVDEMRCLKAVATMPFQTPRLLVADVHAARLSILCFLCLPLSPAPSKFSVAIKFSKTPLLVMWTLKAACRLLILFSIDHVCLASSITSKFIFSLSIKAALYNWAMEWNRRSIML